VDQWGHFSVDSNPVLSHWSLLLNKSLDIARGMEDLHSLDIVHKDLKSDNLLIATDNSIKIPDFWAARIEVKVEGMTSETGTYWWISLWFWPRPHIRMFLVTVVCGNWSFLQIFISPQGCLWSQYDGCILGRDWQPAMESIVWNRRALGVQCIIVLLVLWYQKAPYLSYVATELGWCGGGSREMIQHRFYNHNVDRCL
jgi:hypothetical protein